MTGWLRAVSTTLSWRRADGGRPTHFACYMPLTHSYTLYIKNSTPLFPASLSSSPRTRPVVAALGGNAPAAPIPAFRRSVAQSWREERVRPAGGGGIRPTALGERGWHDRQARSSSHATPPPPPRSHELCLRLGRAPAPSPQRSLQLRYTAEAERRRPPPPGGPVSRFGWGT